MTVENPNKHGQVTEQTVESGDLTQHSSTKQKRGRPPMPDHIRNAVFCIVEHYRHNVGEGLKYILGMVGKRCPTPLTHWQVKNIYYQKMKEVVGLPRLNAAAIPTQIFPDDFPPTFEDRHFREINSLFLEKSSGLYLFGQDEPVGSETRQNDWATKVLADRDKLSKRWRGRPLHDLELRDFGLSGAHPGQYNVHCPLCSSQRQSKNRHDKCCSVKVNGDGKGVYNCHNCHKTGHLRR